MRVAVTGAGGRLGRAVCAELLAAGCAVVGIDRTDPHDGTAEGPVVRRVLDLRSGESLKAALEGCDAVVHLAALPTPAAGTPAQVWGENCETAGAALFAAADAGIRAFVLASSQSALGLAWAETIVPPAYLPADEDHPCWPSDAYSASKLAGELLAAAWCRRGALDVRCLRFPVIWDPAARDEHVRRRLDAPDQAAKSLWAYVDLRDAARAVRLCLERPRAGFEILNVTAARAFAPAPVAELVERFFPRLRDIRVPLAADTALFDPRRAEAAIGFRARHVWTPGGARE